MPYRPFTDQNCSIAGALSIVGERWTLLIMRDVLLGRRRFADIKRSIGVASNILTDRLEMLVEHELLRRKLYSEHPESYEYVPTRKGVELNPVIIALMQWGDRYAAPEAGPPRVPVHTTCGHDANPQMHCGHCGETIQSGDLRLRPGPGATQKQIFEGTLPRP
ncbi:MAG TPA: helix-turn-helix domain-containing protein [Solirubrobacteraceae bacterium]